MAEKHLACSKHFGTVTRPLTNWRLDASKAVWEAEQALKVSKEKYEEAKEKNQAFTAASKPTTTITLPQGQQANTTSALATATSDEPPTVAAENLPVIYTHTSNMSETGSVNSSDGASEGSIDIAELQASPRQPIKYWPKHV